MPSQRRTRADSFLFEPRRFIRDPVVRSMSPSAMGAYIRLFCAAWDEDEPGVLPDNDAVLAGLAQMSHDEWAAVREAVAAAFKVGDGQWVQKGLRETLKAQDQHIQHQRNKGKGRAKDAPREGGRFTSQPPAAHQPDHQPDTSQPPAYPSGFGSPESPSAPTEPRTLEACDATHRAGAPDSQREAAAKLIRSLSAGDDMAKPPPVAPPKQPWRAAVFAVLEGQDAATKAEAFKIAGKMDKGGVCRSPELLAEVIRDWLPKRHRINPFAYYASGGEGFEWMMQRYSRMKADAEAAQHKAEEEQWRHL